MNTKRLYIGDLYYNCGLETADSYKIDLVEKDVLLVKFGNKYINAKYLNSYTDLISFYTLLKYYPTTNIEPMSYYMFNTNDRKKDTLFVDKDSLKRYRVDNSKISFNKFKTLTLLYDYEKKN